MLKILSQLLILNEGTIHNPLASVLENYPGAALPHYEFGNLENFNQLNMSILNFIVLEIFFEKDILNILRSFLKNYLPGSLIYSNACCS